MLPIADPETGTLRTLSPRTIERMITKYEREGIVALGRSRRSDAGRARVHISAKWDSTVPFDAAAKAGIAARLRDYIRAQHKNHESAGNIAFKAARKLAELTREAGFDAPSRRVRCSPLNDHGGERLSCCRPVPHGSQGFEDDRPGVRRTPAGLAPMQVVVGDVHHLDFVLREVEGFQRTRKLFAGWTLRQIASGFPCTCCQQVRAFATNT